MSGQLIGVFLIVVILVCVGGWIWGTIAPAPRAGSKPADNPAGGYASAQQVADRLSVEAVHRAGAQVRPGLAPVEEIVPAKKRKGLPRGRR